MLSVLITLAQSAYDQLPIRYSSTAPADRVAELRARKVRLSYEPEHGYLKSVLKELGIPASSQVLVF